MNPMNPMNPNSPKNPETKLGDAWYYVTKDGTDFNFIICGVQDSTVDIFIPMDQSLRRINIKELNKASKASKTSSNSNER
jgi:hypothetical protein